MVSIINDYQAKKINDVLNLVTTPISTVQRQGSFFIVQNQSLHLFFDDFFGLFELKLFSNVIH